MLGRGPLELGLKPLEKECCQVGAETSKGEIETGSEKAEPQSQLLLLGCRAIAGAILLGRAMNQEKGNLCFLPPTSSVPSGAPCWQKPGDSLQGFSLNNRRKGGFRVERQMVNNQHNVFSRLLAFTDIVSPPIMFFLPISA